MALNPTQEQIQNLLQSGHEGPVAMVNLLTFKDKNSYLRYAAGVEEIGGEFGLKLLFWGDVVTTVIGEDVEFQTIAIRNTLHYKPLWHSHLPKNTMQ